MFNLVDGVEEEGQNGLREQETATAEKMAVSAMSKDDWSQLLHEPSAA